MKKYIKKIGLILIVLLIGIQFIPKKYNNNTLVSKIDFIEIYQPSQKVEKLIKTSCYDCHSNYTNYPFYSKIQPIAMLMNNHIEEGKEELNFSEFGNYSKRRKKSKIKSIISQIKKNEMPLKSYTLIHKNAVFTTKEKELLTEWLNTLKDSL